MVANKKKELTYEQRLEIVFYHNNGKSYREISNIIGCSKSAAFDLCKKFGKNKERKKFAEVRKTKNSRGTKGRTFRNNQVASEQICIITQNCHQCLEKTEV